MSKTLLLALASLPLLLGGTQARRVPDASWFATPRFLHHPRGGYVTRKETAIAIGKAVLADAYGPGVVARNGPFDAKRFGDVWLVYSFVPAGPELVGGYAVEISASTGTIVNTTLDQ